MRLMPFGFFNAGDELIPNNPGWETGHQEIHPYCLRMYFFPFAGNGGGLFFRGRFKNGEIFSVFVLEAQEIP